MMQPFNKGLYNRFVRIGLLITLIIGFVFSWWIATSTKEPKLWLKYLFLAIIANALQVLISSYLVITQKPSFNNVFYLTFFGVMVCIIPLFVIEILFGLLLADPFVTLYILMLSIIPTIASISAFIIFTFDVDVYRQNLEAKNDRTQPS